ncbi:MAG: hypothetical protein K5756_05445 [Clostridiales bacterium]|nr:hypothetical protein [Clostridiales bacterium]
MESKNSKIIFFSVVSVVCVIALFLGIGVIRKNNAALEDEHKAVSEYYGELNLPTNAEGVMAKSLPVHIEAISDGHIVATTRRNNSDFFSNRLVWIKFEGENLQERVRDLDALSSKIIGTEQTVAYFTVDKEHAPELIIAYDLISLDENQDKK